MNIEKLERICLWILGIYLFCAAAFFFLAGEQLHFRVDETAGVTPAQPVGELIQGMELRQAFTAPGGELLSVDLFLSTYGRNNTAHLTVSVLDDRGSTLGQTVYSETDAEDNSACRIYFPYPVPIKTGERYTLCITSEDGEPGNTVTAWVGNTMSTSRAEVVFAVPEGDQLRVNGQPWAGQKLQYSLRTRTGLWFGDVYWQLVLGAGALLAGYCLWQLHRARRGEATLPLRVMDAFQRYGYLMRQLIARDFKTKYKRSVLGVLWSFLNPLLTMAVQYVIFSTLFRSDIPNFAVYLLTGIVCFNFFSEATSMALTSIVGNAALITKVYVPKYIYPLTRVISSTINFLLALIPLLAVLLVTHTPIRPAILLMPAGIVCLFAVSLGIGMLLASAMVFFRDTQFLWSVLSMLWMYATPIIYPESIIPASIMPLYKCNPLYHIVRFIRIVLMDGISPEPKAYALMFLSAVVPLLLGALVFKKTQDRFILHI